MSRVELFERIRRDARQEGLSVRTLARRHHVHRRTVRQALASSVPLERAIPDRDSPTLGPWKDIIAAWLRQDLAVPRKQRHTSRRIWQRLVDEHGAQVAESTVRPFVSRMKAELGRAVRTVAVPQTHPPGQEAEVDFGQFVVWLHGELTRVWMFCMRLSHSGRAFHAVFSNEAQESFFEGHVRALAHFGGVPSRIRYDNLKPAVLKILLGRARLENERFIALRSHYGFDSFFCIPGSQGAHEKGGVEGEIGRFRRGHLVPVPRVGCLGELEAAIAEGDRIDDDRHIEARLMTVGEAFAAEAPHLGALPSEPFDATRHLKARADHKSRLCVRQAHYSVPARFAGRWLQVRLGAREVVAIHDGAVVARHERAWRRGAEELVLDHYLEVLLAKPGALAGATALVQARATGAFTATHDAFWAMCRRRLGDRDGTKTLIEILLVHRSLPALCLVEAMQRATYSGLTDAAAVIVEARRLSVRTACADVVAIGELSRYDRPAPVLLSYDDLLEASP